MAELATRGSTIEECDQAVADLAANSEAWRAEPALDAVGVLERLNDALMASAQGWVEVACQAKRIPADEPVASEEWASVAITARYVRLLASALSDIAAGSRPRFPGRPHPALGGRTAVPAFPFDAIDKVALSGFTAEVWLRSGVTAAQATDHQAGAWFGAGAPGVSLVLGAGNQSSIPITDALDRLFIARHPVILKMNPVNDYLGPILATVAAELVDRGVLRIVYGGEEVGTHLVNHPAVTDVHVTGSDRTFEAIVFGGGDEGRRRKAAHEPLVTKPVSGELASVTPVIVVPGPWEDKDISFHAQNIASMLTNNAGFNCVALRAVITSNTWELTDALLGGIRDVLNEVDDRYPYYPGARDRYDAFVAAHPDARRLGDDAPGCVPWTAIPDLHPGVEDEIAFTVEAFNGVYAEVGIDAPGGTVEFIHRAVAFANDELWGTLGCSLIVHPKSLKDPEVQRAFEQAIADLRYGTIAVNHWSGLGFLLGSTPWGSYPGQSIYDVQSGIGFVRNSMMLADGDIEKTVCRGPFRMPLKPTWFVTSKTAHKAGEQFARLMAKPSWGRLPGLVTTAMRG
ncbi:MAG TPA: aldehyde dehydrogenase family protein [Mycobacteriales bacterium]|nr:aldehyde dehydrogenase family protein [Mycobacteriales bacterium]